MRTRLWEVGAAVSSLARVLMCASALCAGAAGAYADEYVPQDCGRDAGSSPAVVSGLVLIGVGTVFGLLMAAFAGRGPAVPRILRHVEAGARRYSAGDRAARPPRLSR